MYTRLPGYCLSTSVLPHGRSSHFETSFFFLNSSFRRNWLRSSLQCIHFTLTLRNVTVSVRKYFTLFPIFVFFCQFGEVFPKVVPPHSVPALSGN